VTGFLDDWLGLLEQLAAQAKRDGELGSDEDPAQLVYELDAFLLMANMAFVLNGGPETLERARVAVRARLERARGRS
jgi:hypothetical protein